MAWVPAATLAVRVGNQDKDRLRKRAKGRAFKFVYQVRWPAFYPPDIKININQCRLFSRHLMYFLDGTEIGSCIARFPHSTTYLQPIPSDQSAP